MDSEEIFRRARGYEISDNRLREAKRDLGIETAKSGFQGRWLWSWPDSTRLDLLGGSERQNHHL
ncbi:MAG: hypothetical protein GX455_02955 [Phycisphaerae bacterium]|nr:hypothetical protein [Phycisphaerae bacterium]